MLRPMVRVHFSGQTNNLKHMVIGIIYLIGCFIALLLGIRLLYKEKNNDDIDMSIIAPLIIMSWISVFLILWKLRDKLI